MRSDLNQMEAKGVVEPSFIQKISALDSEFTTIKQYWVNQKTVSVGSAFVFYSATHNTNLILAKMKNRFKKAQQIGDNPKVACDSLLVMPVIYEVYQRLAQAMSEKKSLNQFLPNEMLHLVSRLRATAKCAGLLPTINEELKKTDTAKLKETATGIDKKFVASNIINSI